MLTFERVEHQEHPEFEAAYRVYEESFPAFERRTRSDQIHALSDKQYHFELIKNQQGEFLGILLTWKNDNFLYIEHLAITPAVRGMNIGTRILEHLKTTVNKPIILEIDPPVDDVSVNRKRFYENVDFVDQGRSYIHYSYQKKTQPHTLDILTFPAISDHLFESFKQHVQSQVMKYSEHNCSDASQ